LKNDNFEIHDTDRKEFQEALSRAEAATEKSERIFVKMQVK